MTHIPNDILRVYLDVEQLHQDGELTPTQIQEVNEHLASCPACRADLAALKVRQKRVQNALTVLDPSPIESARPARSALKLLSLRLQPNRNKEMNFMKKLFLRPTWAVLTLVVVLAASLTLAPVRALAGNFLDLFRVQQVTLLPMDMTGLESVRSEPTVGEAISQLFSDSVNIQRESSEPVEVASAAEASEQSGFGVRLPTGEDPTKILVTGGPAFDFTVNVAQAQSIVADMGSDVTLPDSLDGVVVSVDIPTGVTASYGTCSGISPSLRHNPDDPDDQIPQEIRESCYTLIQLPSPTVTTSSGVDPVELATVGLQVLGMSAEEAAEFSQSVDWTSTLVIPIPRGSTETEQITVDGVSGNILRHLSEDDERVPGYTIMWVKDGILYNLFGVGDEANALEMANTLQ